MLLDDGQVIVTPAPEHPFDDDDDDCSSRDESRTVSCY
jgi:hypothetical protein